MASSSVQELPKVLNVSLLELLQEQNLVHWSINSNVSITSVVIRFAMHGSHDLNTPVTWRKSPSQYRRDTQRNTDYVNQQNNNTGLQITSYHDSRNSANLYENNEQVCGSHTNINISPISTPI